MGIGVVFIFIASIVLLHFVFFYLFGFPLTVAPLFIVVFFLKHYCLRLKKNAVIYIVLLYAHPLFVLFFNFDSIYTFNVNQFLRTYCLWLATAFVLVFAFTARINRFYDYRAPSAITISVIGIYSIIQVTEVHILGSTSLYFPFGKFSYLNQTDVSGFVMEGSIRANSFYLEPSFSAFVIFFLLTMYLMYPASRNRGWVSLLVSASIYMFVIGSAIGIIAVLGLVLLTILTKVRLNIISIIFILLFSLIGIYFFLTQFGSRLIEIGVEGSSGYWRLIAPLYVIASAMEQSLVGIPLGQISEFVFSLGLQHGQSIGSSIDNGLFVILFNFGLPALLFFCFAGLYFMVAFLKGRRKDVIFLWFIFIGLQFSGAVYTPEFLVAIVLVIYSYRCRNLTDILSESPKK